jgi:hypothetical protein
MQLTFTSLSSEAKSITLPYPADLAGTGPYEERITELSESWGKFKISDLWFEGVCVMHYRNQFKTAMRYQFTMRYFLLDNEFCIRWGVKRKAWRQQTAGVKGWQVPYHLHLVIKYRLSLRAIGKDVCGMPYT